MTLHFLGGVFSGIWNTAKGVLGGIFGGGTGTGQQATTVPVQTQTDWTPLYIIAGLIILVMLLKK